jgi:hypothetical protein
VSFANDVASTYEQVRAGELSWCPFLSLAGVLYLIAVVICRAVYSLPPSNQLTLTEIGSGELDDMRDEFSFVLCS